MNTVFADASYWIAIANPRDQWHNMADQARKTLGDRARLVTTDAVLMEFLTGLSASGDSLRKKAVVAVRQIMHNPNVRVIPQTRNLFLKGLELYEERPDKEYSLQDCISMVVMEEESMTHILTSDHHFEQENSIILMKKR